MEEYGEGKRRKTLEQWRCRPYWNPVSERTNHIPTWPEAAKRLIAVAGGRECADLVIRNCRWVNVQSREILDDHDIAIADGRFAYCGPNAEACTGDSTQIVDAAGQFAIPGFCDGHMHIESGMLTPARFAEAVLPHGTTTMFADPHEIGNVLGLRGVRLMHDEAMMQPINIYMQMPSCVPSAPGLETSRAEMGAAEVAEAMAWPGIIGLGEVMDFPGVVRGDDRMLDEIAATQDSGRCVGGHYASPDLGRSFHAYAAGGPADDHEGTREIDAIARVRQGMRAMLRLGSAWYDVEAQLTAVTEKGLDSRNFILCTDDCHAGTLVADGHMDRVVRHAISCGCDPLVALQMATVNTATHFGLEREIGSIAPGRRADLILTSSLTELPINSVFARGQLLAKDRRLLAPMPRLDWPQDVRQTVNIGRTLVGNDFRVVSTGACKTRMVRVIGVIENQAPTKSLRLRLPVRNGTVDLDPTQDVCLVAVVERHRGKGSIVNGFVQGFGYANPMGFAATVAHDCHHMIVVGTDRDNMAAAANSLATIGGGISFWRDGQQAASVPLPIAGLMSDQPAASVATAQAQLNQAMAECGCRMNNAYMQHTLLALAVIPELRISDLGIVDTERFELVDILLDD